MVLWIKSAVVGDGSEENPYRPILSDFLKERNIGANYTVAYHPNSKKPILALVRLKEDELEEVLRELEDGKLVEILDYKKFVKFVRKYKAFRRCWEDQPAWPAFKSMADGSGDPVETRYFRNDTHTVNGLSGYKLLTTSTDSLTDAVYTGECWNQGSVAYYYIHFYIRHSDGSKVELGDAYKSYSGDSGGTILVDDTCSIPAKTLYTSDAIEADPEIRVSGTSYTDEKWITNQLEATKLSSATWHVYWKIDQYYAEPGDDTVLTARIKLGDSDTRIENFSYGWQDYKKVINETVSLAEQITRVGGSEGGTSNWLSGWQYRKSHEINGSSAGSVTDYQIRIKVHYGSGTDSGEDVYLNEKCRSDFGDVRFTDDDGTTVLDYWMEEKSDSDYAIFWVKVPSIPSDPDSATIYIYYGKSDATYAGSGSDTFLVYEDWESGSIGSDWTKSQVDGSASYGDFETTSSVKYEGSYGLIFDAKSGGQSKQALHQSPGVGDYAIEAWIRNEMQSGYAHHVGVTIDYQSGNNTLYFLGIYSGSLTIKKWNGSSWGTLASGGSKSYNTWLKIKAYRLSSGLLKVTLEGETISANDTSYTSGGAGFFAHGGASQAGEAYYDLIFVRKYIDPEPSHGDWGSEETAGQDLVRVLIEEMAISEGRFGSRFINRIRGETLSITEAKMRILYLSRVLSETISIGEGRLWLRRLVRKVAETVNISEALAKAMSYVRLIAETVSLSELKSVARNIVRAIGETVDLTEAKLRFLNLCRVISESVSVSEAKDRFLQLARVVSETLSLEELTKWVRERIRVLTETIELSEAASWIRSLTRKIGEIVSLVEARLRVLNLARIKDEIVGVQESVKWIRSLARVISETINVPESVTEVLSKVIVKIVDEAVSIAEGIARAIRLLRIKAESISIQEAFVKVMGLVRLVAENVGISEVKNRARAVVRFMAEVVSLEEVKARARSLARHFAESVSVEEAKNYVRGLMRIISEEIQLIEAKVIALSLSRIHDEVVELLEMKLRFRNLARVVGETLSLIESRLGIKQVIRVIGEMIDIDEASARFRTIIGQVVESVAILEDKLRVRQMICVVGETVAVLEEALSSLARAIIKVISEVLEITEVKEFITLARRFLKGAITLLERSGTITITVIRKSLSILKRRGEVEVEE